MRYTSSKECNIIMPYMIMLLGACLMMSIYK